MDDFGAIASKLPKFDVRQMRVFLYLADELHFGRAATRLCTSQSAVSSTIHALEDAVGIKLLERSTRRVRLTEAGEAFAAEVRLAFSHMHRASTAAQNAAEGKRRLRIGYNDFSITGRLPVQLNKFRAANPSISLDLHFMPSSKQRNALLEGKLDIGLLIGEFNTHTAACRLVEVNDYVALLPDTHRLARVESLRLIDLAEESFVLGDEEAYSAFRQSIFELCNNRGFHPRIELIASNTIGIFSMVAAGVGVSIFGSCGHNLRRAGVTVKTLDDVQEKIPIYASWLTENPSPALSTFRDFLAAQELPEMD